MRRAKLSSESGRIWAGMGGVLLMAAGAAVVAMVAFSTDSPASRVPVAQADHNTLTEEQLDALPNGTQVTICHTEGNGSQHVITVNSEALTNAGHFAAPGNPLHAVGDVHDFIIQVEDQDPLNDEADCNAVAATPTATQAIATATQQVETTSTPTTVPPTNTPEATATLAIATATQQVEATSTPTTVPPTNTPEPTATEAVPPTNTPTNGAGITAAEAVQATPTTPPLPPASVLDTQAAPTATPPPAVRALPATGNGGYEDSSLTLIIGVAMILAGTSISLVAMKRRA